MQLNEEQRQAVESRGKVLVSAGAGSGKTSVLVERYISLIEKDGLEPENILCLTFTRKAASEMYRRIHDRLKESTSPALRRAYKNFEPYQISTIDAFCSQIIRPYIRDFGYPNQFSIDEGGFSAELEAFVYRYIARPSSVLDRLLEAYPLQSLVSELFLSLAYNFSSIDDKGRAAKYFADSAFKSFTEHISQEIAKFIQASRAMHQILVHNKDRPNTSATNYKEHHRNAITKLSASLKELTNLENADSSRMGFSPSDTSKYIAIFTEIQLALHVLSAGRSAVKEWKAFKLCYEDLCSYLLPALHICSEWEFYEEFYSYAQDFLDSLARYKRQRALLYFRNLLEIAVRVLLAYPDYADIFRRKFRSIMIDEFQDNNKLQKDLLFLLACPLGYAEDRIPELTQLSSADIFLVGDQKQSIYRFRGADVSIFKSLERELKQQGTMLSLSRNYRSNPCLIGFFNAFFPRIMGGRQIFEAEYMPLLPSIEEDPTQAIDNIELILIPDQKLIDPQLIDTNQNPQNQKSISEITPPLASNNEAEAFAVAQHIYNIVNEAKQTIFEEGRTRAIAYEDIVILYRTSTIQHLVEKMLRGFGIPYSSDTIRSLFLEAPAFDTHAFLKFCLFPEDTYSFAALLRSPFCRLGDDSIASIILQIAEYRKQGQNPNLAKLGSNLNHEETQRYTNLITNVEEIQRRIDHIPHTQILAQIWKSTGYLDVLNASPATKAYLEHYDFLLEFFDQYQDRPMVDCIEDIEDHLNTMDRIENIDVYKGSAQGVCLMTIHKAKGLEFPLVYVINTNGRGRTSSESSLPCAMGGQGELLLYAGLGRESKNALNSEVRKYFRNPLIKVAEDLDRQKENAELRRLLYVALTRAEQKIVISAASIKGSSKQTPSSDRTSPMDAPMDRRETMFDLISAGLDLDISELNLLPGYSEFDSPAGKIGLFVPKPYAKEFQPMQMPRLSHSAGPEPVLDLPHFSSRRIAVTSLQAFLWNNENNGLLQNSDQNNDADAIKNSAQDFGTLVHLLLEQVLLTFKESRTTQIPAIPQRYLRIFEKEALSKAIDLVQALVQGNVWEEYIQNANEIYCEHGFNLSIPPFTLGASIDLILRNNNTYTIIDYKTGSHVDAQNYALQLDIYRYALGEMLAQGLFSKSPPFNHNYQEISKFQRSVAKERKIQAGIYDVHKADLLLIDRQFGMDDIQEIVLQYRNETNLWNR